MGGTGPYVCPSDTTRKPAETDYVMPVGPGAIADGPAGAKPGAITDGTSNTIAIAEMSSSVICWTEPRDLDVRKMSFTINDPAAPCIRSNHPGIANVLMADGSVQTLSSKIDPQVLRGMLTIAGGEPFNRDALEGKSP